MENFDHARDISPAIKSIKQEKEKALPNLDEIAGKYAHELRNELAALKKREEEFDRDFPENLSENESENHLKKINIGDLTHEDLIIFDKFKKNTLTDSEFKDYQNRINEYINLQRGIKKESFKPFADSRENFAAFILNKMIDGKIKNK